MGSVGTTAQLSKQRLATYYEARKFLDRRFNLLRFRGFNRRAGKPCQQYWWVRTVNEQWAIAARHLRAACAPQGEGRGKYDRVRTIHPGRKVKLKNSTKLKARVHKRSDRRGRTGLLQKNRRAKQRNAQPGRSRGRPALTVGQRKQHAKVSAAKKARRRRLNHHPKRAYPSDRKRAGQPESRAVKKGLSTFKRPIASVRGQVRQHHRDDRQNHDTRYAYRHPVKRRRARRGHHSKPGIRGKGEAGNRNAALVLIARSIFVGLRRRSRLRQYWRKVKRLAQK